MSLTWLPCSSGSAISGASCSHSNPISSISQDHLPKSVVKSALDVIMDKQLTLLVSCLTYDCSFSSMCCIHFKLSPTTQPSSLEGLMLCSLAYMLTMVLLSAEAFFPNTGRCVLSVFITNLTLLCKATGSVPAKLKVLSST